MQCLLAWELKWASANKRLAVGNGKDVPSLCATGFFPSSSEEAVRQQTLSEMDSRSDL